MADSQTKRLMGSEKEELAEGFEVGSLFLFSQSEWFQAMRIYLYEDFFLPHNPIFLNG